MQNAATVLTAIRKRGLEGKPLERIYRQLFNPDLYLLAYGKIARNSGAMTPGVTREIADDMSLDKIEAIIDLLRHERYKWTPTRRVYIEKKNSKKKRPLGIPIWSDKLVQEVLRLILEAYYEPRFSEYSHGFRPHRSPHTALRTIHRTWRGTAWFIEGDIKGCFDNIDHSVLLSILAERIHDGRFLALIEGALKAGYLEDCCYHGTYSGTPQGGIISPILANIYLDRLDRFVEETLLPAYNRGDERRGNPPYVHHNQREHFHRKRGHRDLARQHRQAKQRLPSRDPQDPHFRRLRYIRYADDYLLGFAGPREEAEAIRTALWMFLRDSLKLEQSEDKTFITHARTEHAQFLGYEVHTLQSDTKHTKSARSINGTPGLRVPRDVILKKCARYMKNGKPRHRPELTNDDIHTIIRSYQSTYRGIVNYYRLAYNLSALGRLHGIMQGSLAKTLAAKLKISVRKVYRRFHGTVTTDDGPRKAFRYVTQQAGKPPTISIWGAISLKWSDKIMHGPEIDDIPHGWNRRSETVTRLIAGECELCGSHDRIRVHHIRHLRDLQRPGRREKPRWVQVMAARRRKTLVVCHPCHVAIHAGQPHRRRLRNETVRMDQTLHTASTGEPDDAKVSRPVRRGADGDVPRALAPPGD